MKYLLLAVIVFTISAACASGKSREIGFGFHHSYPSLDSSVRKSVFKIKGQQVERKVYFEYLKCKHCRSQLIGSSVFIGIGAIALAGSIPLFLRTNGFSGNGIYYGSGGVVLANIGVLGLCVGIPFTIKNLKEYKTKYNGKCDYQTVYLFPQLTGFAFAYRF